jgi:DNA invertase Pin-like site-specific DNA recombinase
MSCRRQPSAPPAGDKLSGMGYTPETIEHATATELIPVAQYTRKSDDHQQYSTDNQSDANHAYATMHGMKIVSTYSDEGISGLTFEKREALKRLVADVQGGTVPFRAILVYDISRWGRYQDIDESAHYEFICRRSGVAVHYCAEQFANDGSSLSSLLKGWKRAMAGEYSRELSVKVFAGQSRLARLGYKLGGSPGYGLRRLLVDQNGVPKCTLAVGEWKSIATDRIMLVPGPPEEVATVRLIYSLFALEGWNERRIANLLNERGVPGILGRRWRHNLILRMLRSEKYVGDNVWNRSSFKLQTIRLRNGPESWIRAEGVFPAIIDRGLFEVAQHIIQTRGQTTIAGRPRNLSDDEMLRRLNDLFVTHGHLSRTLIDAHRELPSAAAYFKRFGGLKMAFELIGAPHRQRKRFSRSGRPCGLSNDEMLDVLRQLWLEKGYLTEEIIRASANVPHVSAYFTRFGSLKRAYQLIGFIPDRERTKPPRIVRGTSNETLLDALRELLRQQGRLSKEIIDSSESGPSHGTIAFRFGGLLKAYALIGYLSNWYGAKLGRPRNLSDQEMLDALRLLWQNEGRLSQTLIRRVKSVPSCYDYYRRFGSLSAAYRLIGFVPTPHRSPLGRFVRLSL